MRVREPTLCYLHECDIDRIAREDKVIEDVRTILRKREALLVHFNTPMTRHDVGYPQDLHDAFANPQWTMCYSTILKSDTGPTHGDPSKAAACGSVGIIIDLLPDTSIISVSGLDSGSDGRTECAGLGHHPSVEVCESSIDTRSDGHNEWFLSGGKPIGIFCFIPAAIFNPGRGERSYAFDAIAKDFPDQRLFSASSGQFEEFDRENLMWESRSYAEILPC